MSLSTTEDFNYVLIDHTEDIIGDDYHCSWCTQVASYLLHDTILL